MAEVTRTQLAQLRQIHAGQQRELAEVAYDIQRTEARLSELQRKKAGIEVGIAKSGELLAEYDR